MISLSACASLSPSSMDTGAPPEHFKAKSSSESDLGSSAQDHHTGFCPTRSRCKIPLHDPHTNQAYFCLRTSTFTHGFLPTYTWLVSSTYFPSKKKKNKYIYIYTHKHTHTHTTSSFFFIHSSVEGHLCCFHVLAVVNSAAINTGVHIFSNYSFVWIYAQQWDCWIIW